MVCNGVGVVKSIDKVSTVSNEVLDDGHTKGGVIVVGGGIGGFALALALQQRGIKVKVYEKDRRFSERAQGYGLTMQQVFTSLSLCRYTHIYIYISTTNPTHLNYCARRSISLRNHS
jgi:monoamine oxidase